MEERKIKMGEKRFKRRKGNKIGRKGIKATEKYVKVNLERKSKGDGEEKIQRQSGGDLDGKGN